MADSPLFWALGQVFNRGRAAKAVNGARAYLEQRASQAGRLIFMATGGQVVRTEVKYETLAEEGYENNPVVYRCVRLIADALKSLPVLVFDNAKDVTDTHPLAVILRAPNPDQTWSELIEAIVGHLALGGETFLEGVTLGSGGRGQLAEIYALRPDKMNVDPSPDGFARAYEYDSNGTKIRWENDVTPGKYRQILHIKNWHPRNHFRGLPMLAPATSAGDEHNQAVAYAKALYNNSARPSGAMVYEPKEGPARLTDDAFEKLKGEMEENYQGAMNAGRPMLLEGGLKWVAMGFSPKDMESGEGRSAAAREIAFALGVPPLMLGIKGDNTFANYEEARLAFWQHTVWPLAELLQAKFSAWMRPLYPNVEVRLDKEGTPIAEAEKKLKWDRVRQADFLTLDEKRRELNYDPLPNGQGAYLLVNGSMMTLDDVIAGNNADPLDDSSYLNGGGDDPPTPPVN